jgi:hypothetical protein
LVADSPGEAFGLPGHINLETTNNKHN